MIFYFKIKFLEILEKNLATGLEKRKLSVKPELAQLPPLT